MGSNDAAVAWLRQQNWPGIDVGLAEEVLNAAAAVATRSRSSPRPRDAVGAGRGLSEPDRIVTDCSPL